MKRVIELVKTGVVAAFLLSVLGCATGNPIEDAVNKVKSDFNAISEKGERDRAEIKARQQVAGTTQVNSMATAIKEEDGSPAKPIQLIVSKDKKVAAAMETAMPNIKKVLAIHQCIREYEGLRQLNFHAVPGVDMMRNSGISIFSQGYPNSMKYHDRSKCVSITTLDQWEMPALNALKFRVVYFADDSGETVNFTYLFKRVDDGSWKLLRLGFSPYF